ncbi:MAG TPA: NAD(P)H-binding protein [Candidatus Methanoperedens sp.]|nr:NAD(P)H-binding protein [Candidatus Methanoperedens sp.]
MEIQAVTGGFGYTGRHIARLLLERGYRVRTLTNAPAARDPFGGRLEVRPLAFKDARALDSALSGVDVLYNTYWVRFNHRRFGHATAVENTLRLFEAARRAGVRRVVHVSITNPSEDSPFEYFRGKARLERALRESGLGHAILRPAILFGGDDILINNIAWMLRRFPVFGVFGRGDYRLDPIHVDDLAGLALAHAMAVECTTVDAVGPESYRYRDLVRAIGEAIGRRRRIVSLQPLLGLALGMLVGLPLRDVVITREEIGGLMAGLLHVDSAPLGTTRFSAWLREHRDSLGRRYASELARRR